MSSDNSDIADNCSDNTIPQTEQINGKSVVIHVNRYMDYG